MSSWRRCASLGIAFVAYSPLGRGFLTGQIKSPADLAPDDWRLKNPRFQGTNFQKNLDVVAGVQALAREKGCTPAQLALAWLLSRGDDIFPIPGIDQGRTCRGERRGVRRALDVGRNRVTRGAGALSGRRKVSRGRNAGGQSVGK